MPFLDRIGAPFTSTFRPAGGVLHADARRRRPRAQPRAARRPCSSPATSPTTRSATSSTHGARHARTATTVDPDSGATGYDGVQARRLGRPLLLPPRPRRAHATRARSPRRSARSRRTGLNAPVVPAGRQPRRARPGRGPADAGDRRVRHRRPARPRARPASCQPPREEAERASGGRARCSAARSRSTRSRSPPTRTRRLERARRGRAPRSATPSMDYTVDLGADVRAILVDTVNRDGTSPGAHHARRSSRGCAQQLDDAGDRWVVVFSHNPLTARGARGRSTRNPQRRRRRSPATRTRTASRSTAATG